MAAKAPRERRAEPSMVQILVTVAVIQMRILKADVEKGSARTVLGRGLVSSKGKGSGPAVARTRGAPPRKRSGLIFPHQDAELGGDASEPEDGGLRRGGSCLFYLTRLEAWGSALGGEPGRSAAEPGCLLTRSPARSTPHENSGEVQFILAPGCTHNRIRSPR